MDADTIARRVSPHLPAGERHVVAFSGAEGPAARLAMRQMPTMASGSQASRSWTTTACWCRMAQRPATIG